MTVWLVYTLYRMDDIVTAVCASKEIAQRVGEAGKKDGHDYYVEPFDVVGAE